MVRTEEQKKRRRELERTPEWKAKHREHQKNYLQKYYQDNKNGSIKDYNEKNKEKIKDYNEKYKKTPQGKKSGRISSWKKWGIIATDWEYWHKKYINQKTCEFCDKVFKNTQDRHLDHSHTINNRDNIRGILCNKCNCNDVFKNVVLQVGEDDLEL